MNTLFSMVCLELKKTITDKIVTVMCDFKSD